MSVEIDFKARKGNFVHDFVGTPPGVHCPTFPVIAWGHGCQFDPRCSFCFLQGTFRMEPRPVVYTNTDKLLRDVEKNWAKCKEPTLYNAGELADSFLHPPTISALIRLFGQQDTHKLLVLTKDPREAQMLWNEERTFHRGQTVVSFSVNADGISYMFERGAGPRGAATRNATIALADLGYPVRFRIDPMIPAEGWQMAYRRVAETVAGLDVGVVTLGSLRYHPTVEQRAEDKRVFEYGTEWTEADRRWRVPLDQRLDMYQSMIGWLAEVLPGVPVGLCKETAECFQAMGINPVAQHCNCVL